MDQKKNKTWDGIIIIVAVFAIIALISWTTPHDIKQIIDHTNSYVEVISKIYYVPQHCINKYYPETIDNEGLMYIFKPFPEGCDQVYIDSSIKKVYGDESESEINSMAHDLYKKLKLLGGNATYLESVIIRRTDDDEFIKDMTQEIRDSMKEEVDSGTSFRFKV